MKRLAVLLAVLVLVPGCAPRRIVERGRVNESAVDEVRRLLPAVRQLGFTSRVPVEALTSEQIRALITGEIEQSYAPGDLERLQAMYVRLGLLPDGAGLRPALQRLYEQEGAGFYDPRTKRLVLARSALGIGGARVGLASWLARRDLIGEFLVSHELTHALQDQHWTIPSRPDPITDAQGDRELARRALLEGDATLAGFAYLLRRPPDQKTITMIERQLEKVPEELARKYPDVPDLLRASLAFQYDRGTAFAGRALANGGWPAVDAAHADPPVSTEQVLHPARYFGTRDVPVAIALGGTEPLEAAGWTRTVEDTLGELQVRVLAARFVPAERAARVADGWGGDRLRAFERGNEVAIAWMTAWDSPAEATEFAEALPEIVPAAHVEQRQERVLVLLASEPAALAGRMWSRTTVRRPG